MPRCPTVQEFCPEYKVGIFAPKLADSIFSGQRKKISVKFCLKVPLAPDGHEFGP